MTGIQRVEAIKCWVVRIEEIRWRASTVVKIEYNKTSPMWADPHNTTCSIDLKDLLSPYFQSLSQTSVIHFGSRCFSSRKSFVINKSFSRSCGFVGFRVAPEA